MVAAQQSATQKASAKSPTKKTSGGSPGKKAQQPANYRSRINEYYRMTVTGRDL
jgi:hypothetical protein